MNSGARGFERIAGITFFALITIGCVVVLRPFVSAILWAAILCFATWPLYQRAERLLRGRKSLAAALMTALAVILLVLPFAVVGFTFAEDVARIANRVHDYSREGVPPVPAWMERVPYLGSYWQALYENTELAAQTLKKGVAKLTPLLLGWSLALGRGILQLALSVLITFFFYRNGPVLVARLNEGIRRIGGDQARHLLGVVGTTVKSVVYGLFGTALAQGIAAAVGFLIAGIPSPFLWALLTFFLSLIPVGPPMVWVPATIWLFAQGEVGWGIFMGVWGLVCISGIDNLVRPILISRGVILPFILTFLGVIGGLLAFGFIGIFIGPTLLAAGFSLVQEYLRRKPVRPA